MPSTLSDTRELPLKTAQDEQELKREAWDVRKVLLQALSSRGLRRLVLPFVAVGIILIVWEIGVRANDIPFYILPAPSAIYQSLEKDVSSLIMWGNLYVTAKETLLGFVFGALLGFVIGIFLAEFPIIDDTFYPLIVAFQSMPKVAIAPLLLIWFGFGLESKIAIAALLAFFPVLVNTALGLRSTDLRQEELMHSLAASRWQVFSMVRFFNALPSVFAGLELAMVFSAIGAIVGEFVGARAGLGYMIQQRNAETDIAGIFAILFILGVFGATTTYTVRLLAARIVFWQQHR